MDTGSGQDDWFGEQETEESPRRRWRPLPERPGADRVLGRERRGGPRVRVAVWRLFGLVLGFVFVVVLVVGVVGGDDAAGADRAYLTALAAPASDSHAVGVRLAAALGGAGLTPASLDSTLAGLTGRQQHDTGLVAAISPAPRLRDVQLQALDAMRLRLSGLNGLRTAFHDAEANPKQTGWAAALAAQANRLLTSDVIWQDLVQAPATAELNRDHATQVPVPTSTFLTNPNLASAASMATVLAKLAGATTTTNGAPAVLKLGDSGPAIAAWQRQLNTWLARQTPATLLTVDGQYGQTTQAATKQFQTAAGISPDGTVGPKTKTALNKTLGG